MPLILSFYEQLILDLCILIWLLQTLEPDVCVITIASARGNTILLWGGSAGGFFVLSKT
jgi:hypothetical protein